MSRFMVIGGGDMCTGRGVICTGLGVIGSGGVSLPYDPNPSTSDQV